MQLPWWLERQPWPLARMLRHCSRNMLSGVLRGWRWRPMLPAPGLWTFACSCQAHGRRMRGSNHWLLNSSRQEHGRRHLRDALLTKLRPPAKEKARKQQAGGRPVISRLANEDRRGQNPRSVRRGALKASTTADCGFVAGRRAIHPFSAGLLRAEPRLRSPHFGDCGFGDL
jgi:hypothetical protein